MQHVRNPLTLEVRYVTPNWARWLKAYGWVDATFEEFMAWQLRQYDLAPVRS